MTEITVMPTASSAQDEARRAALRGELIDVLDRIRAGHSRANYRMPTLSGAARLGFDDIGRLAIGFYGLGRVRRDGFQITVSPQMARVWAEALNAAADAVDAADAAEDAMLAEQSAADAVTKAIDASAEAAHAS